MRISFLYQIFTDRYPEFIKVLVTKSRRNVYTKASSISAERNVLRSIGHSNRADYA